MSMQNIPRPLSAAERDRLIRRQAAPVAQSQAVSTSNMPEKPEPSTPKEEIPVVAPTKPTVKVSHAPISVPFNPEFQDEDEQPKMEVREMTPNEEAETQEMLGGEKKTAITPEEIADVAHALEENKGEVDKRMEEIINSTEVNPDAELDSRQVDVPIGDDPLAYAVREDEDGIHIDLDLLESEYPGAQVKEIDFESDDVKDSILGKATNTFNMSDEEAFEFYLLVKDFKSGRKKKIKMADLPMSMRMECAKQVEQVGGTVSDYDMFAQLLVQTFTSEIEQNQVFIDIEKELDEALKIPSVMDMFFEHSHKMAHEHIPEMITKCEEAGDMERAALLKRVGDAIDDAFSMKSLIEYYKSNTRVRKACRRDTDKVKKYIAAMNYNNEKTKFRMQDATGMLTAMSKVFIEDYIREHDGEQKWCEEDIIKFVILVCDKCTAMDPNSIVSATYMYYLMKNVITLTYVEEAKTEFARQLIDNISDVMSTIIDEEAEFNAANPKREGKQKRSKRDKRRRHA